MNPVCNKILVEVKKLREYGPVEWRVVKVTVTGSVDPWSFLLTIPTPLFLSFWSLSDFTLNVPPFFLIGMSCCELFSFFRFYTEEQRVLISGDSLVKTIVWPLSLEDCLLGLSSLPSFTCIETVLWTFLPLFAYGPLRLLCLNSLPTHTKVTPLFQRLRMTVL